MAQTQDRWTVKRCVVIALLGGVAIGAYSAHSGTPSAFATISGLILSILFYLYLRLLIRGLRKLAPTGRLQLSLVALLAIAFTGSLCLYWNVTPWNVEALAHKGYWIIGFPLPFYAVRGEERDFSAVTLILDIAAAALPCVWAAVLGNWLAGGRKSKASAAPQDAAPEQKIEIGR